MMRLDERAFTFVGVVGEGVAFAVVDLAGNFPPGICFVVDLIPLGFAFLDVGWSPSSTTVAALPRFHAWPAGGFETAFLCLEPVVAIHAEVSNAGKQLVINDTGDIVENVTAAEPSRGNI